MGRNITLDAIRNYRPERDFDGTRRNNDRTPVASVDLKAAGARSAEILRVFRTEKPASPVAQRVAAVKAQAARPTPTRPVAQPQITFAMVDELAATIPPGFYALPRKEASTAGNTVTFFEVIATRKGSMVRMLVGAPSAFQRQPLKLNLQYFALTHIAEDAKAAAILFGRETKTCGMCGSPLTNEASRKAGIGPRCARKFG